MGITYTIDNLTVDLPVQILQLTSIEILQEFNQHGRATITGLIDEKNALFAVKSTNREQIASVSFGDRVIFCGIPTNISIQYVNQNYVIQVVLTDMSILLDLQKRRRSFQNKNISYRTLMEHIAREYDCRINARSYKDTYPDSFLLQYDETDWEFLKRISSFLNTYIVPHSEMERSSLSIGCYDTGNQEIKEMKYSVTMSQEQRMGFMENGVYLNPADTISYEVQLSENYCLGSSIRFRNEDLIVTRKIMQLKDGVPVFCYTLQKKEGTKCLPYFNKAIQGIGIKGRIIDIVDGYKLKVKLVIDDNQEIEEANPFDLATPYSNEGNTGWYMMPEIGEEVLLYIPTNDERSAYIKKVIQKEGDSSHYTRDPEVKYLGIVGDSELLIRRNEMVFKVTDGKLYTWLSERKGIIMHSNEDILLTTGDNGIIECNQFIAEAKGKVTLHNEESSIIVDRKVHIHSQNDSQNPVKINTSH